VPFILGQKPPINDQYFSRQFASLDKAVGQDPTRLYLTFGGLEDSEDADDTSGVKTGILLDSFSVAIRKSVQQKPF